MSTNNLNTSHNSSVQFSSLLGCTLESIIHEMIYSRSIYPPDSFAYQRHLNVRFHCSRVPPVCDYISKFLMVAVPSIISGVGDSISLVILEEEVANHSNQSETEGQQQRIGTTKTLERFVFRFEIDNAIFGEDIKPSTIIRNDQGTPMELQYEAMKRDTELAVDAKAQMERSMRDCLLQVLSLRGRRKSKNEKAENLSFKLCLHIGEHKDDKETAGVSDKGRKCPELVNALKQGDWFQPEETSCQFSTTENGIENVTGGLMRPIRNVNLPSCGMKMQIGFEVPPGWK